MPLSKVLFVVFIVLKLCHVIDWSWIWITAPFWASVLYSCWVDQSKAGKHAIDDATFHCTKCGKSFRECRENMKCRAPR